jgi:methionyl-tRNA synthetase
MITIDDFKKLNLKVATVTAVQPHPNADRLYLVEVDLGGEKRQLVAGIRQFYTPEELVGKQVVVVENMTPAVIRGVESKGMILAAQGKDRIVIVSPEKPVEAGGIVK